MSDLLPDGASIDESELVVGGVRATELADRRDVGAEALLGEEPEHGDRRERLRPVGDERAGRRREVRLCLPAERRLVVDDEGRPELTGELRDPRAAEDQLAVRDGGAVRQEVEQRGVGGWLHPGVMVTLSGVNLLLT